MKKILTTIIFALIFFNGVVDAKEVKKTIHDLPKVAKTASKSAVKEIKTASKTASEKTKTKAKEVKKVSKTESKKAVSKGREAVKELKSTAKTEKKKLNQLSAKSSKNEIAQPESKRLLAKAAEKKSGENRKNLAKTVEKKTTENKKLLVKAQEKKSAENKKLVVQNSEKRQKQSKISEKIISKKIDLKPTQNYISFAQTGKTIKFGGKGIKKSSIQFVKNSQPQSKGVELYDLGSQRGSVIKIAKSLIGTPYRYGSMNPKRGFDCSGFVSYVYLQKGIKLPRSSSEQFSKLAKVSKPQAGDLVFFRHGKRIGHVGMYLGDGLMVHSPQTGDRVKIESMEKPNWKRRYAGARKAINTSSNSMIALK